MSDDRWGRRGHEVEIRVDGGCCAWAVIALIVVVTLAIAAMWART